MHWSQAGCQSTQAVCEKSAVTRRFFRPGIIIERRPGRQLYQIQELNMSIDAFLYFCAVNE
jgi:hypothetical protein